MLGIVMAEWVSPRSVVTSKTDEIPAYMVLVAAIAAHSEESVDCHFSGHGKKITLFLSTQKIILRILIKFIESPCLSGLRE